VKEVGLPARKGLSLDAASFAACLATILELPADAVPEPPAGEDPAVASSTSRWLGGLGLGSVRIADPKTFTWPGPWIARAGQAGTRRCVVMYGVPSGVIWDPAGGPEINNDQIEDGFVIAASDIALAMPQRPAPPASTGTVETICLAASAGEPARPRQTARALAGRGLEGDRHVTGAGTFPSGLPGSALTLIEAEVCESFDPPLTPSEHRRNVVTRGVELNGLVGREFSVGRVRCRGMRLCEPCTVVQRYASRPVLRQLVHRGGLRADILEDGEIAVGDELLAIEPAQPRG
jgi:MOSC domain